MEPYKAKEMPLEYKIDKEMFRLISEANVKYGEYKFFLQCVSDQCNSYIYKLERIKEIYKEVIAIKEFLIFS